MTKLQYNFEQLKNFLKCLYQNRDIKKYQANSIAYKLLGTRREIATRSPNRLSSWLQPGVAAILNKGWWQSPNNKEENNKMNS